jgi:Holliday junction resolvase
MINSRDKGARGERHVASFLTSEGFPARRGVQFSQGRGTLTAPDVICPSLPEIHIEVKFTQQRNLEAFFLQASRDAGSKIPAVFSKKNNSPLFVTLKAEDFLTILRRSDLVASNTTAEEADDEIVRAY